MAVTRARSKAGVVKKSPKKSPKAGSKNGTPQKRSAPASNEATPTKKAVKEPEQIKEPEPEFELPSDSDDDSDDLEGLDSEAEEAKEEFVAERNQIDADLKNIISHQVKTQLSSVSNAKSAQGGKKQKTGILYVGRLPRGFEEYELKKYFEQFGTILNLRVSRNKKTGNSKHYAFIEFENFQVAQIAAETMNNYLIFGHIIKVSVLTHENLELFKNSNTKFKRIPWLKISKLQNDRPKKIAKLNALQKRHDFHKAQKSNKLKELGINYSL